MRHLEVSERLQAAPALFTRAPPVFAALVLLINDHALKGNGVLPSGVTGKLSDFAGLYFAPLLVAELWCWLRPVTPAVALRRVLWTAVGFGLLFVGIKLSADVRHAYDAVVRLYARPFGLTARTAADATDLFALPVLILAWLDARRVLRRGAGGPH